MVEMDCRVGEILDEIEALGIAEETMVIFASDNGPEFRRPWRGTAGPWVGTYHTAMEGGLRAPCIIRWPGQVPAGGFSNEIVHVADLYTTLARVANAPVPADRPIDGVDQLDFFKGARSKSNREGHLYYIQERAARGEMA
jgi:arylsulfatase A-like enzyme